MLDQLVTFFNEQEAPEPDDGSDIADDNQMVKMKDLSPRHYVQSMMSHLANLFNFISSKGSTVYKNVNAAANVVVDCDCNDHLGRVLSIMKEMYLDANPATPSFHLLYASSADAVPSTTKHEYGARYVLHAQRLPEIVTAENGDSGLFRCDFCENAMISVMLKPVKYSKLKVNVFLRLNSECCRSCSNIFRQDFSKMLGILK